MSAVALQVMKRNVPRIQYTIPNQRHSLPVREGTDDFHGTGIMSLAIWQAPAEDFGKGLSTLCTIVPLRGNCFRTSLRNKGSTFGHWFAAEKISNSL